MGFFARRGRELYTVGRLDTATDLDVLAIRYSEPLSREVCIAECKTAGGEGPLDRIFWLSGVKKYVDADFATLIRPATKWNIKDFATEVGVELFDLPHVDEPESGAWESIRLCGLAVRIAPILLRSPTNGTERCCETPI